MRCVFFTSFHGFDEWIILELTQMLNPREAVAASDTEMPRRHPPAVFALQHPRTDITWSPS
jgi:hypothetical protein